MTPDDATPERTRRFLEQYVHSLDDLLILLHLHAARGHQSIEPIALAVQLDIETTEVSIHRLVAVNLLVSQASAGSMTYAYAPNSREQDLLVADLARLYEHSRFDVISWLMAASVARIRKDARSTFSHLMRARRNNGD